MSELEKALRELVQKYLDGAITASEGMNVLVTSLDDLQEERRLELERGVAQ